MVNHSADHADHNSKTVNAKIDEKVEIVSRLWGTMAGTIQRSGAETWLEVDVPMAQMRVIFFLSQLGTAVSIGGIAEELEIGLPAASRLVERLIHEDLVTRSEDPTDRRRTLVRLTDKGVALMDNIRGAMGDKIRSILSQLQPEDLDALLRGLQAVQNVLRNT